VKLSTVLVVAGVMLTVVPTRITLALGVLTALAGGLLLLLSEGEL
jgi:hypothetical protein